MVHSFETGLGSTREDPSRHNWKIVDWDVKNQIKQNKAAHEIMTSMGLVRS